MGRIAIVVGFQITSSDWDRKAWSQFYHRIKVNSICLVLIFFSLVGFYFIDIVREVQVLPSKWTKWNITSYCGLMEHQQFSFCIFMEHYQFSYNGCLEYHQLRSCGRSEHHQFIYFGRVEHHQFSYCGRMEHHQFNYCGCIEHHQFSYCERMEHHRFNHCKVICICTFMDIQSVDTSVLALYKVMFFFDSL